MNFLLAVGVPVVVSQANSLMGQINVMPLSQGQGTLSEPRFMPKCSL
jgi:hypothetical protein